MIFIFVILPALCLILIYLMHLFIRNIWVENFRSIAFGLLDRYEERTGNSASKFREKLPNYNSMLYSFRRPSMKRYFSEEELKELNINH